MMSETWKNIESLLTDNWVSSEENMQGYVEWVRHDHKTFINGSAE